MKRIVLSVASLLLIALPLIGCGGKNDQVAVARAFWSALEAHDLETARHYATRETAQSLTIQEEQEGQEITIVFGEVSREDEKSMVATTITTSNEGIEMSIPLQTVMVKEEGAWKVDVNQTMMSMLGGAMGAMMEGLTESMKDGMEELGEAMADQMKASMEEALEK